jgi:K+-sensing histidine kinase KdpD
MGKEHVLVCVTGQKTCETLILEGAALARQMGAQLSVLHVAGKGLNFLGNPVEGEALEYLYRVSSENGAAMMLIRADDVLGTIIAHAEQIGATQLVMGHAREHSGRDVQDELVKLKPDLRVHTVLAL